MKFIKSLYIHQQFYIFISVISATFLVSFWFPVLYMLAWFLVIILIALYVADIYLLYRKKNGINGRRILTQKFSNSDNNPIPITIKNNYSFNVVIKLIDELPKQFQKRDFEYNASIKSKDTFEFEYEVRPLERGEYHFGKLNVYVSSFLKLVSKRYSFQDNEMVAVYPSYIQMRKYEFLALSNRLTEFGLKKIRRIGHTLEFEQIKNYVVGDDARTINWKATAKQSQLMVNQFQDEKSQPIYSVIDLGRVMKMPFEELKLLDYAINSALAFSNIALRKNDKAGLVTFAKKVDTIVAASNKKTHLNVINEALYNIDTKFTDSDFGYLYAFTKRKITQRSLFIVYTNFEHVSSLKRQMQYLQAISKNHLLVVVFFENTELDTLISNSAEDLQGIYHKTIAEKFAFEKRLIVKELESKGIYAILTKPKNLTVNVINKYLEFKAKGYI
ncbi:Uncharacterized conserved protein, DUF58 family, contains vWF domain [Lutibacter oricola]|uniref:Uncharacterized conserved protein, DUF58 family, contains vWF domain n=1 Tax=Lutibacter oricola TaxID=762486 RepID=A0A1H3F5J4_9FLAO|nr:DUF58 domain-containing protein [Lutibacter oricola]SDX86293.1 Uncharacterized conserved protein, DUF58 family, contains vWF domain [Lutibacter oricola]